MTTTFLFMALSMSANEIKQHDASTHAGEAPQPQLAVFEIGQGQHDTLHGLRTQKRQDAFEDEVERKSREQIRPIHAEAQRLFARFKYLKNSLSGEITNTSLSVPMDSRYACRLR